MSGPNPSLAALERLMPMLLWLDATGRVAGLGATLARVCGAVIGRHLAEVFEVQQPASGRLRKSESGEPVRLRLWLAPHAALRGQAVALPEGGWLLNLSFGIGVIEAVRSFGLTHSDFAPTDLAVELLYLSEAKNAVGAELARSNARLAEARAQAEAQALTDPLTGTHNRRALDQCLSRAPPEGYALLHLDLDDFKQVNDDLGHAAGDAVLQTVARRLRRELRSSDSLSRVGGDEFVILLPGVNELSEAACVAERLVAAVCRPIRHGGETCHVGVSIGYALSRLHPELTPGRLLALADRALYRAKAAGKSQAFAAGPQDTMA